MYDSLGDKSMKCMFCEFEGEFRYKWTSDAFIVVCPSCKKTNYEIAKEKIDGLAREIINDSICDLEKAKDRRV